MKKCHIITDHKLGHINAANGFSKQLESVLLPYFPLTIQSFPSYLPTILHFIPLQYIALRPQNIPIWLKDLFPKDYFDVENFPDIIIANSRISNKINIMLKLYSAYINKKLFTVQLQRPYYPNKYFDCIIAPNHDRLQGRNIISTLGSLNHITQSKIDNAYIPEAVKYFKYPIIGVCIGGKSNRYQFNRSDAEKMARDLKIFMHNQKISLMVTPSRRTGAPQENIIKEVLGHDNVYFWDQKGENPYFAMLKLSKSMIVTADSANMLSEAATAGKNILLYPMKGNVGKFKYLYNGLRQQGYLQDFSMNPEYNQPIPLNETLRSAMVVRDKIINFFS